MAIGVYEDALELPHPAIHLSTFIIVENALRAAWKLMKDEPSQGFDLASAGEDEITEEFRATVYKRIFYKNVVAGFNPQVFYIIREAKFANYDNPEKDLMPELVVGIIGRPETSEPQVDGLFIECKPIDNQQHAVGGCYCEDGLIRFIDGRYAWAMQEGMMIAYAQAEYTILTQSKKTESLDKALRNSKRAQTIPTSQYPKPCSNPNSASTVYSQAIHITKHKRVKDSKQLRYKQTNKVIPPITIRHLWLWRD